jgi:hypothetical protein
VGAVRVLDRKRMARIVAGVAAVLVVAGLGTLAWGGPMGTILRYSVARPCPADAPAPDCVATVPATVNSAWTDYGDGEPYETLVGVDVRGPFDGEVSAWLAATDAARLGVDEAIYEDGEPVRVEVTMFGGEVVEVIGAGGDSVSARYGLNPKLATAQYLLMVLVAAVVLAGAVVLWRRLARRQGGSLRARRRSTSWLGPVVRTAIAAAFAGQAVTVVTSGHVAAGWTIPILGIVVLVVTSLCAFLSAQRLREPFAAKVADSG